MLALAGKEWKSTDVVPATSPAQLSGEWLAQHVPAMRKWVFCRWVASDEEAKDLVSEAVLRAWERGRAFDGNEYQAGAWLYRILRNLTLDLLRHRAVLAMSSLDEVLSAAGAEHDSEEGAAREVQAVFAVLADWPWSRRGSSVEAALLEREWHERVRAVLDRLPPVESLALVAHHMEGLTQEETGVVLGRTKPAAKSVLYRARQRFLGEWDQEYGEHQES